MKMKTTNCLKFLLTVAFVVGVLSSANADQKIIKGGPKAVLSPPKVTTKNQFATSNAWMIESPTKGQVFLTSQQTITVYIRPPSAESAIRHSEYGVGYFVIVLEKRTDDNWEIIDSYGDNYNSPQECPLEELSGQNNYRFSCSVSLNSLSAEERHGEYKIHTRPKIKTAEGSLEDSDIRIRSRHITVYDDSIEPTDNLKVADSMSSKPQLKKSKVTTKKQFATSNVWTIESPTEGQVFLTSQQTIPVYIKAPTSLSAIQNSDFGKGHFNVFLQKWSGNSNVGWELINEDDLLHDCPLEELGYRFDCSLKLPSGEEGKYWVRAKLLKKISERKFEPTNVSSQKRSFTVVDTIIIDQNKTGGFVPKSDEKAVQTKQGESSLGPEGLKIADVKPFDGPRPLQQFGPPALTIKQPFESQRINVNDDWLYIVVEVNPGFEIDTYLLEMNRLEEVSGKIVKPKGRNHMWQPTGSILNPSLLPFPILIKTSALIEGKLGSYRVRVRGNKGGYKGGYTQWRHFKVLDKGKLVTSESLSKKGGGFIPKKKDTSVQFISPSESSVGMTGTKGVGKSKMTSSSVTAQKTKIKSRVATVQTPKPNIVVDKVRIISPPKSGKKTNIYVYFRNTGQVKSSKGTEFTVKCKSAPKCFLADKKVAFMTDIPPGEKYVWIFETETLTAGFYKMEVITTSNSIIGGNKRLIEWNVPGMVLKKPDPVNLKDKSKKKSNIESVQPVPTGPGTRKDLKKTPTRTLGY
jgi:hypothetical protein